MDRYRTLIITITILIFILSISIWLILIRKKDVTILTEMETYELQFEWLWDGAYYAVEDWHILHEPRAIIEGPDEQLIISDTGNSRIIRLTKDGQLVEIIGREGQGPTEFKSPWDITFTPETSTLWIVDHDLIRVSRFRLDSTSSYFIDTFKAPQVPKPAMPSIVVLENDSFWFYERGGEKRIQQINTDGETIQAFGDLWIPENIDHTRLDYYNWGYLTHNSKGNIIFVWMARPQIELWETDGQLLVKRDLQLPEIQLIQERELPEGTIRTFILTAYCHQQSDVLYILVPNVKSYTIYALGAEDLVPRRRFIIPDMDDPPVIFSFIADPSDSGVSFWGLDWSSMSVFKLESRIKFN